MSELDQEARALIAKWQENVTNRHLTVPERLYHYADLNALQGIIETQCLWATDLRFVNDARELDYPKSTVDSCISEIKEKSESSAILRVLDAVQSRMRSFRRRVFSTSFSTDGDALSQWRGYSNGASSVSIGFNFRWYRTDEHAPCDVLLMPVNYDATHHQKIANEILHSGLNIAEQGWGNEPEHKSVGRSADAIFEAMFLEMLSWKDPLWRDEREWRMVSIHDYDFLTPLFRPTQVGLAPYIEQRPHDFRGPWRGRLQVREITVGPGANADLLGSALVEFCRTHGYHSATDVKISTVPLR